MLYALESSSACYIKHQKYLTAGEKAISIWNFLRIERMNECNRKYEKDIASDKSRKRFLVTCKGNKKTNTKSPALHY